MFLNIDITNNFYHISFDKEALYGYGVVEYIPHQSTHLTSDCISIDCSLLDEFNRVGIILPSLRGLNNRDFFTICGNPDWKPIKKTKIVFVKNYKSKTLKSWPPNSPNYIIIDVNSIKVNDRLKKVFS